MNTVNWPNSANCPACQSSHKLDRDKAGRLALCQKCGRKFHLLPVAEGDDTTVYDSGAGGEAALPAVGLNWLDLRAGMILCEKYMVVSPLGNGGLSRIFKVLDLDNDRFLALKLPLASTVARLQARALFQEARAWLKPAPHPNLVTCEEFKTLMGLPAIFMEYVPGGDLAALMGQGEGPLYRGEKHCVVSRIMDILIQVTRGLTYAHSLGLSQLDIKPRNILIGRGGRVLISDYGPLHNIVRKALEQDAGAGGHFASEGAEEAAAGNLNKSGQKQPAFTHSRVLGTYQYFSPEAALALPGSGYGSDLWAVSLTALEFFFGRRLWEMGSTAGLALENYLATHEPRPKLAIPGPLMSFFKKALARKKSERYQTAAEMEKDLCQLYLEINYRPYARRAAAARPESQERLKMKAEAFKAIRDSLGNERE